MSPDDYVHKLAGASSIPDDYVHSRFHPVAEVCTQPANNFMRLHMRLGDFIPYDEKLKSIPRFPNPLLCDLVLSHMINRFLVYLVDLLALILQHCPDKLNLKDEERLDEKRVYEKALKKAEKVSYRVDNLVSFFGELGFHTFPSPEEKKYFDLAIGIRNIIVHNDGIVDDKFKKKFPDYPAGVRTRLIFDFDTVKEVNVFLANAVCDIDTRAVERFNLPHFKCATTGSGPMAIGGFWSSMYLANSDHPEAVEPLPIGADIGFLWRSDRWPGS